MSVAKAIRWRRTIKKYDVTKKISAENLNCILEAGRMAPSSLGLEVGSAVVIRDKTIKENLSNEILMSSNIEKGVQADTLIFLAGVTPERIISTDFLSQRLGRFFVADPAKLVEMVDVFYQMLQKKYPDPAALRRYISEQVHLTVGFMALQAADLEIGSTIMGGINEILATKRLRDKKLLSDNKEVYLALSLGYVDFKAIDVVLPQHRISATEFAKII